MSNKKHAGTFLWSIALYVDCPHCKSGFDANSIDDFSEQMQGYQVCQEAKGRSVVCPDCDAEFAFDIGGGT